MPALNGGGGMVGVDDAVEYEIMDYKKTGDEFWLNATIDQGQCAGLPDPQRPQVKECQYLKNSLFFIYTLFFISETIAPSALSSVLLLILSNRIIIVRTGFSIRSWPIQNVSLSTHGICPPHRNGSCPRCIHRRNHHAGIRSDPPIPHEYRRGSHPRRRREQLGGH